MPRINADRTFRERRDQYLGLLERQLSRFQSENARLAADVERLNAEVFAIQQKLEVYEEILRSGNYGSRPGTADSKLRERSRSASRTLTSDTTTVIRLESTEGKPDQLVVDDRLTTGMPTTYTNFSSPFRSDHNTSPGHLHKQPAQLVAQLDLVVVAMEFVLKYVSSVQLQVPMGCSASILTPSRLESPCLPHIHDVHSPPPETNKKGLSPQGHVHLLSATVLSCIADTSPASTSTTTASPPSHNHTHSHSHTHARNESTSSWPGPLKPLPPPPPAHEWHAPRTILQKLLSSSEQLPKQGGEVTPVQAWALLQQHRDFAWLTVASLARMQEKLLVHVRCYGFGGVVKVDFLEGLLDGRH